MVSSSSSSSSSRMSKLLTVVAPLVLLQAAAVVTAKPLFFDAATGLIGAVPSSVRTAATAGTSTTVAASSSAASTSTAPATASTAGIGSTNNNRNNTVAGDYTNPYIQNGRIPVYTTCRDQGTVAMTFDDGTQPSQRGIADLLNDNDVTGTFFVNGMNYRCIYDPEMVDILRETYAAGHQIANHGWSHDRSSLLSDEDFDEQVELVEEALIKILGIKPAYFRPPYGDYDDANIATLAARNYSAVTNWNHVSGSGTGTSIPDSYAMYANLATQFPAPQMVLQHEQDQGSPNQILPQAITELKAAGYRLVSVEECLGIPAYQWVGAPQQRDDSWTCAGKPGPGQPHRH